MFSQDIGEREKFATRAGEKLGYKLVASGASIWREIRQSLKFRAVGWAEVVYIFTRRNFSSHFFHLVIEINIDSRVGFSEARKLFHPQEIINPAVVRAHKALEVWLVDYRGLFQRIFGILTC